MFTEGDHDAFVESEEFKAIWTAWQGLPTSDTYRRCAEIKQIRPGALRTISVSTKSASSSPAMPAGFDEFLADPLFESDSD